jgi:hypothetical protein
MTTRPATWITALLILASCTALALALGGDIPANQPVSWSPDWPAGLRELLDGGGRVDGYFINANSFLFFHGDAKAFNKFVQEYAKLKDTPLSLLLHPGRGMSQKPWADHKPVPFEWEVAVLRRGWAAEAPKAKPGEKGQYIVMVELWLGGEVALDDLDVPLSIEVLSGMDVEKFIAQHEAKRSLVPKDAK